MSKVCLCVMSARRAEIVGWRWGGESIDSCGVECTIWVVIAIARKRQTIDVRIREWPCVQPFLVQWIMLAFILGHIL